MLATPLGSCAACGQRPLFYVAGQNMCRANLSAFRLWHNFKWDNLAIDDMWRTNVLSASTCYRQRTVSKSFSPHTVGFHPSQTDFILLGKISFAEGKFHCAYSFVRAMVGVAALWGHIKSAWVDGGCICDFCNSVIATNTRRREEPFRGIGTRACTISKSHHFRNRLLSTVPRNDILGKPL